MSKYTTEVRFLCEHYAGIDENVGYNSTGEIISKARSKIFDFNYPIFDESYRSVLETKILKHFYTREIGAESVGLWKMWLNTRLNEIMPYYNKLYESELLEFNPFYDVNLTRDHKRINVGENKETGNFTESGTEGVESSREVSGTESSNGDTNSTSAESGGNKVDRWEYYSDTPQGGIEGVAGLEYLTNARHITDDGLQSSKNGNTDTHTELNGSNSSNESYESDRNNSKTGGHETNGEMSSTEDYLEHVKGKNGSASYSKLLLEYRQTFLNIDMRVIDELNDLFMNLW